MKKTIIILILLSLISCRDANKNHNTGKQLEKCPCDSTGRFFVKGKNLRYYYFGKSLIELKQVTGDDTVEITRFYYKDKRWRVQEYMLVAKEKMVDPEFAIYCSIKDTADSYKLSYIMDEELVRNPDISEQEFIGVEAVIEGDTINSESKSVLIPKKKFKGIIKLIRKTSDVHKGKKETGRTTIHIDTEKMIEYGDLLEQYKVINRLCEL
jgi:hypothetical protein